MMWDSSVTRGTILEERKVAHVQKGLSPLETTLLADQELCLGVPKQKEDYREGQHSKEGQRQVNHNTYKSQTGIHTEGEGLRGQASEDSRHVSGLQCFPLPHRGTD